MKISFEVTEDDFMTFQEHFRRTSPLIRRNRRMIAIIAVAVVAALSFVANLRHGVGAASISAVAGALLIAAWCAIVFRFAPRLNRSLYRSAAQDAIGPATLEVTPEGLRTRSKRGEAQYFWDAIGDVTTTPTHTFIYVGKMQGIIVPQHRILNGNYPAFMEALAAVYARRHDAALQSIAAPAVTLTQTVARETTTTETVEPLIIGKATHDPDR